MESFMMISCVLKENEINCFEGYFRLGIHSLAVGFGISMILFSLVPIWMIGWIIMPLGTIITLWVLLKKIKIESFRYYLLIAIIWTLIAVVFDYFFLVIAFNPADGYYKLDVYLYYILIFIIPLIVWLE